MTGREAVALALQALCPVCTSAAGTDCVPPDTRPELNDPHLARIQRALVVTDAIRHNQSLETP